MALGYFQPPTSTSKRLFKLWSQSDFVVFFSSHSPVPSSGLLQHSLFWDKPCVFSPPGLLPLPTVIFLRSCPSPPPAASLDLKTLLTHHFSVPTWHALPSPSFRQNEFPPHLYSHGPSDSLTYHFGLLLCHLHVNKMFKGKDLFIIVS